MILKCILLSLAVSLVYSVDQGTIDYMGHHLKVQFAVISNLNGNSEDCDVRITLTNVGNQMIPKSGWEIYFNSLYMIEPTKIRPVGALVDGFRFEHVNGILFKFAPSGQGFNGLSPETNHLINLKLQYWLVSRTSVQTRWYVVSPNTNPRLLVSTVDVSSDFVAPFDSPEKYKRYEGDLYAPFTAEDRFLRYSKFNSDAAPKQIIPTPTSETMDGGQTVLDTTWRVTCDTGDIFLNECNYLQEHFELLATGSGNSVSFVVDDIDLPVHLHLVEAYELQVTSNSIRIRASTAAGAFYGVQSLVSLAQATEPGKWSVPLGTVKDAPRFEYRGMHLDVARNFVQKEDVITLLKAMAMYKMNNFHFHLTDDEGWRVEIKSYPELTSVGGNRAHDLSETMSIIPQLGSGPTNDTSGSGFYTVEDYREILTEAQKLHIRVIPEVDLPGHAHAAVKANLVHYNKLGGAANASAADELISDLEDPSVYESVQLFKDNAVNPCISGTYRFVKTVVRDLIELHQNIQPLTVFHLGGDEVGEAWVNSTKCINLYSATNGFPTGVHHLLEYFMRNASAAVLEADNQLGIGLWEDGAIDVDETPYDKSLLSDNDVITYTWQTIWEWGLAERAYKLANAGYKVVMSQATHLYFDHPYEPDPEERGLYWATRFTEAAKTFGFMPENVYANADAKRSGEPYNQAQMCAENNCTRLTTPENILGMQCQLFSETILTQENFHYMVFPRLLACAERAWHKAQWEATQETNDTDKTSRDADWSRFSAALADREFGRLAELGIAYRLSPPGFRQEQNAMRIACEYPNMPVQCREESQAWETTKCGNSLKFSNGSMIECRTTSLGENPQRFSRSVIAGPFFINEGQRVALNMFILSVSAVVVFFLQL